MPQRPYRKSLIKKDTELLLNPKFVDLLKDRFEDRNWQSVAEIGSLLNLSPRKVQLFFEESSHPHWWQALMILDRLGYEVLIRDKPEFDIDSLHPLNRTIYDA